MLLIQQISLKLKFLKRCFFEFDKFTLSSDQVIELEIIRTSMQNTNMKF